MATIIGGNGTGTLDSSLYQLSRNDATGAGAPGHDEQVYINVTNGNVVVGHVDEFLPSDTNSFTTLRTYNSRGEIGTADGEGWMLSEFSRLSLITPGQIVVLNADGSQFTFNFDPHSNLWRSVDGAGAYETITFDARTGTYNLTQSNQTVVTYDFTGRLLRSKDTNGNTVSYDYDLLGRVASIADNSGHKLVIPTSRTSCSA
jgi:YD repeat-containing protein